MSIVVAHEGVNRAPKVWYASAEGVNRKLKRIFAARDGVNRKIFNGAVTWTYNVSGNSDWKAGNDGKDASIAWADLTQASGSPGLREFHSVVTYEFSEPVEMISGDTIVVDYEIIMTSGTYEIQTTNSANYVVITYDDGSTEQINSKRTKTFSSEKNIVSVKAVASGEFYIKTEAWLCLSVRINSGNLGSFWLNNSGTSENQ